MAARTILITGATGTVGTQLVAQLVAAGAANSARALVRSREKGAAMEAEGVELAVGDFAQPETLGPALDGVERVFLLSAPNPRQVEWEANLVRAAREAGTRHVVKLSAIGASASAPFSLGRWHGQIEAEVERSGLAYTHLRPNGFMQNTLMYAPGIRAQGAFYAPLGTSRVSYVDARDVARVAAAALTAAGHENQAYTLTGPAALSYDEVAREFTAALGKEVRYVDVPLAAARASMIESGVPDWLADALVELFEFYSEGGAEAVTGDVRRATGVEPIPFAQFAADYKQAFV